MTETSTGIYSGMIRYKPNKKLPQLWAAAAFSQMEQTMRPGLCRQDFDSIGQWPHPVAALSANSAWLAEGLVQRPVDFAGHS